MPPLVTLQDVSIGFRGPSLLDEVSCQIESGQRIGLLGRNGAGKTTLMRMINGQVEPDSGNIHIASGVKIAFLQQDVPQDLAGPVRDVVETGVDDDNIEEWERTTRVETILSKMNIVGTLSVENLSSGMKRRVLLAKALVNQPDLLLLDEPTNHLDIEAIDWLEEFLLKLPASLLFVTHDRMFLRRIASRILEIDRGRLFDWTCDYDTFLKRKEQALAAEEKANALFDKRLAEEEAWIRQGIKARRTRNEGRVRALKEMRRERADRREKTGVSNLQIQEAEKSGRMVIEAKDLTYSWDTTPIVSGFTTQIMRGDRIGVIGPNGVGKSTLLKLLLGKLKPDSGSVRTGTNIEIAYFDQLREQLDESKTVIDDVGDGNDTVKIGETKKHVLGYLQDFLFTPERARTQIKFLSGGERNRILLAKLFTRPANLLIMDEPTNDLDSETLELLEERLSSFSGTLLLVSHDREFLNNVVTSTIVFENSNVKEYVGGYDDWLTQRPPPPVVEPPKKEKKSVAPIAIAADAPRKLKYKEKRELEELPEKIESLESEIAKYHERMADPGFYKSTGDEIAKTTSELEALQSDLDQA
ncbi:MAG: ATP-binding cassette domain-containing protein, partial [Planctomycetota bacterium]